MSFGALTQSVEFIRQVAAGDRRPKRLVLSVQYSWRTVKLAMIERQDYISF